jgi:hypothetical protein
MGKRTVLRVGEENTREPTKNNIRVEASKILPNAFPFHGAKISLRCVGNV